MLHQHAAAAAVARRRPSIRRATRAARPGSCITSAAGCKDKAARDPPAAQRGPQRADVGLPDRRAARRAGRRGGAAGDQRPSTWPTERSLPGSRELANDGIDRVRLLDLLRRLSGSRPQSRQRARAARLPTGTAGASRGRPIAASSTTARRRGPTARPWSERKKLVWWDARARASGPASTCPTSRATKPPDYVPPPGATRRRRAARRRAVHHASRRRSGWIWVPVGLKDGPLPAHYEPLESPVANPVYPRQQTNPAADQEGASGQSVRRSPGDPRFPHVLTTYRLTEHHTAGGMTRTLSHLAELQPEFFCEISPELAGEIGVDARRLGHGRDRRAASIEARALVTPRMPSLRDRRPPDSPGRPPVSLGHARPRRPAIRPTTSSRSPRSRTSGSWKPRGWSATSAGPAAAAARRLDYRDHHARCAPCHDRASSPTRRSASAARPARWPARNGTTSRRTASTWTGCSYDNTLAARPLDVAAREVRRAWTTAPPASAGTAASNAFRGSSRRTSASTARTPAASRRVRPARSSAPSSARVYIQPDVCNGCGYCVVGCPFGVDRSAARRRARVQVHLLLRPPEGGLEAGVREGVSDGVDPVRRARRAARAGATHASTSCTHAALTTRCSTIRGRRASAASTRCSSCAAIPRRTTCRRSRRCRPSTCATGGTRAAVAAGSMLLGTAGSPS